MCGAAKNGKETKYSYLDNRYYHVLLWIITMEESMYVYTFDIAAFTSGLCKIPTGMFLRPGVSR